MFGDWRGVLHILLGIAVVRGLFITFMPREECAMRRTDTSVRESFFVSLCLVCALVSGFGGSAIAEEPAEVSIPAEEAVAETAVEDLSRMSVAELEAELDTVAEELKQAAVQSETLRKDMWVKRQEVRRESEPVRELRQEIQELKQRIERVLDEDPGLKADTEKLIETQTKVRDLTQKRRALLRAIAEANVGEDEPVAGEEAPAPQE